MVLQRVLRQATITAQVFDVLTDLCPTGLNCGTTGYLTRMRLKTNALPRGPRPLVDFSATLTRTIPESRPDVPQ